MNQYSNAIKKNNSYKIILVGPSCVGKSCLLVKYVDNYFNTSHVATIGLDFRAKNVMIDDQILNLELWDSAAQERYRTIVLNYFKLTKAACVIFDVTKFSTLQQTQQWFTQLESHCGQIVKVLIGNKMDILRETYSTKQQQQQYLETFSEKIKNLEDQFNCKTFYTSAKTGQGVDAVFNYLAQELYKKYKKGTNNEDSNKGMKLTSSIFKPVEINKQNQMKKEKSCC